MEMTISVNSSYRSTLLVKTGSSAVAKVYPDTLASNVYMSTEDGTTVYDDITDIKDTNYSSIFLYAYENGSAYVEPTPPETE